MNTLIQRFLRYIAIDTQSDNNAEETPSTPGQWELARLLKDELITLGVEDVIITEHCFVHGKISANITSYPYRIGMVGHLDTSPEFKGSNINPIFHHDYDGGPLTINAEKGINISSEVFPALSRYIGHDLVTADGHTLLGGDGKAGIAEIMTFIERIKNDPSILHGDIHVMFTPDEETDRGGIHKMDRTLFPVDFAITLDGDGLGEINFENFNAAHALVKFNGCNVHPGEGKDKLKNAVKLAADWISRLPEDESPESTSEYQGFYHVESTSGNVTSTELYCLIRDFDAYDFMQRKNRLHMICQEMNRHYGPDTVTMTIHDDYRNMSDAIEKKPWLSAGIIKAIEDSGLKAAILPIRGGSDGAWLAELGIPSPNLFIGVHYGHGPYEFASVQAMEKVVEVLVSITRQFCNE